MQIKISRSSRACHLTGKEFVHDEEMISLVRMVDGDLVREDYAKETWEPARAQGAYSVWTTRFYDPQVAEQEPEEVFSPLRQVFYDATASEDRIALATAFMAAQMLRRQKVFKQIKEADDTEGEGRSILYTDRIGNRLIEVKDPQFTYAELQEGSNCLMRQLAELEGDQEEQENATSEDAVETVVEGAPPPVDTNDETVADATPPTETTEETDADAKPHQQNENEQHGEPAMATAGDTSETDDSDETE